MKRNHNRVILILFLFDPILQTICQSRIPRLGYCFTVWNLIRCHTSSHKNSLEISFKVYFVLPGSSWVTGDNFFGEVFLLERLWQNLNQIVLLWWVILVFSWYCKDTKNPILLCLLHAHMKKSVENVKC